MTDETNYSKRELDRMFSEIQDKLEQIIAQTTLTNGTVRWTVKMIYLALGGLGVIAIIVIPLLFALISAGKI